MIINSGDFSGGALTVSEWFQAGVGMACDASCPEYHVSQLAPSVCNGTDLPPRNFPRSDVESAQPEGADEMRKSRFTEAQIIGMIKEQEAG
ncbi:MAG: hypothetical protein KKB02_06605, partial [Alphaproteobacteria bacterium]|nr:hypothetical protein [Alphaproteobacteria bacterium]